MRMIAGEMIVVVVMVMTVMAAAVVTVAMMMPAPGALMCGIFGFPRVLGEQQ